MIKYQARISKDGKGYSVKFHDLPGCLSTGKTKAEAAENAREALSLYLEDARDPKWMVPKVTRRSGKDYIWIYPYEDVSVPLMIRHARLKHKYTQKELAAKIGITFQQLQKLETPGKSNPTVRMLVMISEALDEQLEIRLVA